MTLIRRYRITAPNPARTVCAGCRWSVSLCRCSAWW